MDTSPWLSANMPKGSIKGLLIFPEREDYDIYDFWNEDDEELEALYKDY